MAVELKDFEISSLLLKTFGIIDDLKKKNLEYLLAHKENDSSFFMDTQEDLYQISSNILDAHRLINDKHCLSEKDAELAQLKEPF